MVGSFRAGEKGGVWRTPSQRPPQGQARQQPVGEPRCRLPPPSPAQNSGHTGQRGSVRGVSSVPFFAHSFNKYLLSRALCQVLGINTQALYHPICDSKKGNCIDLLASIFLGAGLEGEFSVCIIRSNISITKVKNSNSLHLSELRWTLSSI